MTRIIVKGGIWKNTEDEVLKAAVMKYGKNQWSRVASLLHRKSAKQCKARWLEWLDPSIKKTDWSRDEEEKLLHLAKLFPTQWRTIAPMVGRTASQCLEHYEKLIDDAQRKEGEEEANDIKKLRPGEMDPNPENKPARPDPVDMDDDEKEMLSEARARLANVQGKKAKRKARERQLEEAKRLSHLQKIRELRAAGIFMKPKPKVTSSIDYNAEIPFRKPAVPGFFDVSKEKEKELAKSKFQAKTLRELDGKKRVDSEEEMRKKDDEQLRKRRETNLPEAMKQVSHDKKDGGRVIKRAPLVLPAPQVSDRELEEIVKLGHTSEAVMMMDSSDDPNSSLLNKYSVTPVVSGLRTPRTPAVREHNIMMEVQNAIALTQQQSALHGGENTPLSNPNFDGITPKSVTVATPNVLLGTPFRSVHRNAGSTPSQTPGLPVFEFGAVKTPLRDNLRINNADGSFEDDHEVGGTKNAEDSWKSSLLSQLSSLPKPKNDFDIVVPETPMVAGPAKREFPLIPDAADTNQAIKLLLEQEKAKIMNLRSKAVKRKLPVPSSLKYPSTKMMEMSEQNNLRLADQSIRDEILFLFQRDSELISYSPETITADQLEDISEEEFKAAASLLSEESEQLEKMAENDVPTHQMYINLLQKCYEDIIYIPQENRFGRASLYAKKDLEKSLSLDFEHLKEYASVQKRRCAKIEKKASVLLGGYFSKLTEIENHLKSYSNLEKKFIDRSCFRKLALFEDSAIQWRKESATDEVQLQRNRNKNLQEKYLQLTRPKKESEPIVN